MTRSRTRRALGTFAAASALLAVPAAGAQAYNPTGGIMYQLGDEPCLKGRGNCAVYPTSAQLPSGRLVVSFERATVVPRTGSADGETLPVYKSDDHGTSWQALSEVEAPAYLSTDPRYAKYTSNWTNPYLYALPQNVGPLKAGTLLLASVVSGDDDYYKEHKAADPDWTPSNDGDRGAWRSPCTPARTRAAPGRSSMSSRPAAGRAAARARSVRTSRPRTGTGRSIPSGSRI